MPHTSSRLAAPRTAPGAASRASRTFAAGTMMCAALARRMRGGEQHAADRPELAGETELAVELACCSSVFSREFALPGRQQDAERDGQVVAAAFLRQIRGREIHRDAAGGNSKPAVDERGAHALLAFAHRGFGHADDGERGQPAAEVHFDVDARRRETELRATRDTRYAHDSS